MGYNDDRPDPDELLASLKLEEEKGKRGKLKIFFGMCAGVGKTYTMLQTAQAEKKKQCDIIVGYVETHNRKETADLLQGLEVIPRLEYHYKSTQVSEMDLDRIIARKPQIVVVDELAHTNAPGSRHAKRYQDVLELLDNGINVYTTVNVQHLESRSDTVAQITGVIVRETLPDEIFENADEIEVVDLTPEELLQRLSEGKVYAPERSKEAIESFFRKGNITALREMALRMVADRVDKQLHEYMQLKRIKGPWKSGLHLLVAVSHTQQSARLLRWAKNLSYTMGADLQAIYVETSDKLDNKESEQLNKNINLARQLGIKFRIITNRDLVKAIVDFAQKENITHIVIGKPRIRNLYTLIKLGNIVNRLIRYSGNIDVYILGSDIQSKDRYRKNASLPSFTSNISQYFTAASVVILTAIVCFFIKGLIGYQVVSFALLFVVSTLAFFFGTGPILMAATMSALIWDFFFLPPPYTLHVDKPEDMLMLIMFFIIALLSGVLTSRIKRQEMKIRVREERTNALYQLTRELSKATGIDEVINIARNDVKKYFNLNASILLKNDANQLDYPQQKDSGFTISKNDMSVAVWTFQHSAKAGRLTDTLPSANYTFYPLKGNQMNLGVIAIQQDIVFTQGEEQFWEAFISQISGKFEREYLRNLAKQAFMLNESDKLYKTLFNSISHELRIPVATIMGASDSLLTTKHSEDISRELSQEIFKASKRLNRLIENLLNMSRLESGRITPRLDWYDIHDLINTVLENLREELKPFNLHIVVPDDMPLVKIDFGLMEQVLYNLIFNATQYASVSTNLRIKSFCDNGILTMQVMDRGPGFPQKEISLIFNKFYRLEGSEAGGTGLGLSIVKGFVEAHNGTIAVENRQNGGAKFTIKIPTEVSGVDLKG
ncbi:MAG: sensor histidine kinase KdpD [Bacteroidales bacterium]|nr:sensor histidine kinase KdpD [Bacteroidales bacterium]